MKRVLLAGATLLALTFAQPAVAQPMPVFNWTGFYVGLQAGYGWGDISYTYTPIPETTSFRISGFVGGGTAGYNWQAGSLVFGVEADVSYADVKGSILTTTTPCIIPGEACSARLTWFGTGRVRLGFAAGDFMPYVTGGVAFGGINGFADFEACGPGCGYNETRWGWTAGGGAEWRFSGNWSAKIEYLYVNLGTPTFLPGPTVTSSNFAFNVVRGGVNVRF